MKITLELLENQPFLRGMSTRQLEILAEDAMLAEFNAGDLIINRGASANRFFLILEGQVDIEYTVDGETLRIETLGKGDVLGWSWLFPPYQWHFDARALTPTRAIFFYAVDLRERCEENHDFGYALMQRISEIVIKRLQATRHHLAEQRATQPVVNPSNQNQGQDFPREMRAGPI